MKKIIITSLLTLFGLLPSFSQQTRILSADKQNDYGLVYSLPLTAFEIEIVALKETKIAGPYYQFANKIISDANVIKKGEINWIIEDVRITPYGVADGDNRYVMQLKPGATTYIGVAEDGMLLSVNTKTSVEKPKPLKINEVEGTPTTGKEYLEYVDEDFISAGSGLRQSQLLGEELLEIRDSRKALSRGTAETMPTDGRQLELMLASLEKQEKALTQAFTGNSWKERVVRKYSFMPDEEGSFVLCRLSDFNGLVDADDYSGDPVYVTVKLLEEPKVPVDAKGEEKKLPKDGVVYCIPGTAELALNFGGKVIYSKNYPMSQFGITFALNPSIFTDKKEPSYAIFNPTTGALEEVGVVK